MDDTPELKAFMKCEYVLEESLNPDDVLFKLFTAEIITRADRGKVTSAATRREKAGVLITAVESNLAANPSNFKTVVAIVKSVSSFAALASKLQGKLL